MKSAPLQKLLLHTQKPYQLLSGTIGALLGFSLILISTQIYLDFRSILNSPDQGIGSQFVIVNKQISVLNSLNLGKSTFDDSEIHSLNKLAFVRSIGTFETNQFPAKATLNLSQWGINSGFVTDMFLEAVDDEFLDIQPAQWQWTAPKSNETPTSVPLILPTDFINLYNFNYAPARGLPQISKETIKLAPFQLLLGDPLNKSMSVSAQIAGFSNRISSVLVPKNFLDYANDKLSVAKPNTLKPQPNKVIIEALPNQLPKLQSYLEEMGYETNQESLRNGKFATLLNALFFSTGLIGLIVIFVSISSFILYLQLAIAQSKYELETLLRLGLSHAKLTGWYVRGIALILLGIAGLSSIFLLTATHVSNSYLNSLDFNATNNIHAEVILLGLALLTMLFAVQFRTVKNQIYRLSLPAKK